MKKKTQKIIGITGVSVLLLSGAATGVGYILNDNDGGTPANISPSVSLSAEEQEALLEEVSALVESGVRPTEIEPKLRESIEKLDKENASLLVREFMRSINQTSNYFAQLLYIMGSEIEYSYTVDDIKNPVKNKEKLSNEFVKGFLNEAERQHLNFKPMSGYYYIEPDATYVLDKYGTYTQGDYKDFLNLLAEQSQKPIFDEEKEMYDVSRLKDNLETIELSRDRWSGAEYAEDFEEMELMLYQAMFSFNHTTFFDLTVENEGEDNEEFIYTLKDDIIEQFESLILENSETTLSKEMEEFLNILEKSDYVLNEEVDTFVTDLFKEKFDLDVQPTTSEEQEGSVVEETQN